ncbi:MAG: DNA cytosine methyltransferase [Deltaproteobacteria bacterium]|jgi:DNA (cytosine-5)-methyltransferase 1|nr:DNA cytosine methyltransferase [Deltaproteobacteria bacterium]
MGTRGPGAGGDVISLFSGAMGLDVGLEAAGLGVRISQDSDAACVATMRANGRKVLAGDIRDMSPGDVLDAAGLSRGEPFLVCGGPPCQPFSLAGRRRGMGDPRGGLFLEFVRMAEHIRPRFLLMENVRGLVSDGAALEAVLDAFSGLGYSLLHGVLDAADYGAPQFRERFFLLGSRDREGIFLPVPTHHRTHQDPDRRWRTLGGAIRDLEDDPGGHAEFSPERTALLKLVPAGGNWRDLPEGLRRKALGGAYGSGGGKAGFFRRLDYGQPSPTLVTSPVQKATMLCHPARDRPLSVREYARIQGFPDGWAFRGSMAERYRQIGNAVPVCLAEAVGRAVVAAAGGDATVRTKRRRPARVRT